MLSVNATTQFSKSSQLISPTHDFNENNPTFNNMLNLLTKKQYQRVNSTKSEPGIKE